MKIPLDSKIENIQDIPYTIAYVIKKRQQVDNLNELPKDKKPPELMIWDGSPEELERWLEDVLSSKKQTKANIIIDNVEG